MSDKEYVSHQTMFNAFIYFLFLLKILFLISHLKKSAKAVLHVNTLNEDNPSKFTSLRRTPTIPRMALVASDCQGLSNTEPCLARSCCFPHAPKFPKERNHFSLFTIEPPCPDDAGYLRSIPYTCVCAHVCT